MDPSKPQWAWRPYPRPKSQTTNQKQVRICTRGEGDIMTKNPNMASIPAQRGTGCHCVGDKRIRILIKPTNATTAATRMDPSPMHREQRPRTIQIETFLFSGGKVYFPLPSNRRRHLGGDENLKSHIFLQPGSIDQSDVCYSSQINVYILTLHTGHTYSSCKLKVKS